MAFFRLIAVYSGSVDGIFSAIIQNVEGRKLLLKHCIG